MKNLTIKKVALGVLLAGYAASGAFALTATTSKTIQGRAPVMTKSSYTGTAAAAVAADFGAVISLNKGSANSNSYIELGDTIVFSFKTVDDDGDSPLLGTKGTTDNIVMMYKDASNGWHKFTTGVTKSAEGTVSVYIGSNLIGAKAIGYLTTAETQYGDPDTGDSYWQDVTVSGDAGTGTLPSDPGTGGGGTTPLVPGPDGGGITAGLLKIAIFKSGVANYSAATNNYSVTSTELTYGEAYDVVVWMDDGGAEQGVTSPVATQVNNNQVDASELAYGNGSGSRQFDSITWGVVGNDNFAHGPGNTIASQQNIADANGVTYTLPTTNPTGFGAAGLQGYNLSVTVTVHQ